MSEVADLFAALGLKVNEAQWRTGDEVIDRARKKLLQLEVTRQQRAERAQSSAARAVASLERDAQREARSKEAAGQRAQRAASRVEAQKQREAAQAERRQQSANRREEAANKRKADAKIRSDKAASAKAVLESEAAAAKVQTIGLALGAIGLYLGGRAVAAGVEFNSTMEESKNQVAGMLALTKNTHLSQEMENANTLVANLQERAAKLPGTTAEYVEMLSNITRPIMDAKLSMKDLEDITVNSVVAAKAFGINAGVAARDIDQALRGTYHSVDPFSGKVLGALGYKGEEGRSRYNALSEAKRASEFKRGLLLPQITELGEAQGKTFKGLFSTVEDSWQRLQGAIAKPLFDALKETFRDLNNWLEKNKVAVAEVAEQIGTVLVAAFRAIGAVVEFFTEHAEFAKALLIAIGATLAGLAVLWIAGFWPVFAVIAAVTGLILLVRKLQTYPGGVSKAFEDAFDAIGDALGDLIKVIGSGLKGAFEAVADLPIIKQIIWVVKKLDELTGRGGGGDPGEVAKAAGDDFMSGSLLRRAFVLPGIAPMAPAAAAAAPPTAVTVDVGGINVNSNAADPSSVADAVGKHFDDKMGDMLRKTMDRVR